VGAPPPEHGFEVIGPLRPGPIEIVAYDPSWPTRYDELRARITRALGARLGVIHHIGSTSVPSLGAKPIVDVAITVDDPDDEDAFIPVMEAAGFVLRVRERGHRMLRTPTLDAHIHVYAHGAPEVDDYLLLRDRLRADEHDRLLYERTKRALAEREWNRVNDYADAKTPVITAILARARRERDARAG